MHRKLYKTFYNENFKYFSGSRIHVQKRPITVRLRNGCQSGIPEVPENGNRRLLHRFPRQSEQLLPRRQLSGNSPRQERLLGDQGRCFRVLASFAVVLLLGVKTVCIVKLLKV